MSRSNMMIKNLFATASFGSGENRAYPHILKNRMLYAVCAFCCGP
ncbi:MAG: hypothetical protein PUB07_02135 [Clostridia bacterium]|nr:hypothetical protein [Clostridia bacterium]